MWRTGLMVVVALCACDEGTKTKAKETAKKVDNAVDKFEKNDATEHVAHANAQITAGNDPAEDCSWLAAQTSTDATKPALAELGAICNFDAPLARAKAAVVRAEKAHAEVPEAPTLTECQSDDWANMKAKIEAGPSVGDAKWGDLKARWAKVCPDQK
jgi:hypothetical protein